MYWDNQASIKSAMKAVQRDARHAMEKALKQKLAEAIPKSELPANVPKRGRMMRQVLQVPETHHQREVRAVISGLLFFIIGGAIALLAAGVPPKGPPPPGSETAVTIGFIVAFALGIIGLCIGYFTGRKKLPKLDDKLDKADDKKDST